MPVGSEFETVLAAAQAGADWAFAVLYREFNPRLLRYFASRAPAQGEDLAAETWYGAARRIHGFSGGEDAFRGWLFAIAHHRLVQHWRDLKRRPPIECAAGPDPEPYAPDETENDSLSLVAAQQAARQIAEVLPPDQAEVVLLRILGDLGVAQVAQILGKRAGAVRVLQHRALRRLADLNFSLLEVTR
jgi:RNA polymerase sigma-70 factor (ECF subfamily)